MRIRDLLFSFSVAIGCLSSSVRAQGPTSHSTPTEDDPSNIATLRSTTRLVTLEVVAKDSKGHHVTGLKPEDFELFEQAPGKHKEKREQKIASFREISMSELSKATPKVRSSAGIYTNAIASSNDSVPPTILLLDGLNTDVAYQLQVHAQMARMLAQLPGDVPVAIYLLGYKLEMLQGFTSDPGILQEAVKHAITTAGQGMAQVDPRDDPQAPGNLTTSALSGAPGHGTSGDLQASETPAQDLFDLESRINHFDLATYVANMDRRVRYTAEALRAIAQQMSGYPGRKNLLWISTSFPIRIDPALDSGKNHDYMLLERQLAQALSDAKIAVYPINSAGVRPPSEYEAGTRPVHQTPQGMFYADQRELEGQNRELDTMHLMADDTGGEVCTGDNDLADCVHRTVEDSSHFYEISYYPDSKDWNGEYRHIILDTQSKGLHLEYRQGYFASPAESRKTKDVRAALQRAACEQQLDSTSILLTAKCMRPNSPDAMKLLLNIGTSTLTFTPLESGASEVNLQLAVCTFDKKGKGGQFMSIPFNRTLNANELRRVATTGLEDMAAIPGPEPASLRLAVMDVPSGRIGTLRIDSGGTGSNPTATIPRHAEPPAIRQ